MFARIILAIILVFLAAPHSAYSQTWWEFASRDHAVWTDVTDDTGVLWLVKGINDVGSPVEDRPELLTSCQDSRLPIYTEWVLRTPRITNANEGYAGIKPCGQDTIGWLAVVESADYVKPGFKPTAFAFGDSGFIKCGLNALLCVDVHIVESRDELPAPLPPWVPPEDEEEEVLSEIMFVSSSASVGESFGQYDLRIGLSPVNTSVVYY